MEGLRLSEQKAKDVVQISQGQISQLVQRKSELEAEITSHQAIQLKFKADYQGLISQFEDKSKILQENQSIFSSKDQRIAFLETAIQSIKSEHEKEKASFQLKMQEISF